MGSCGEAEKMMCSKKDGDEDVQKKQRVDEDEVKEKLPGFRFHPTDEELVSFYLRKKVENKPLDLIKEIDIYKYDPWELTKMESINVGEKEWFFFCMRGRKYRNSVRPNRVTGSGFWKATGIDKQINADKDPRRCVGLKKSLVYYRGHAGKGTKTDWMMHEFRLPPAGKTSHNHLVTTLDIAQEAEVWTLCRIFKRVPSYKKYTPLDSSKQNPAAAISTTIIKKSLTVDSCSSLDSECIDSSYVHSRDNRVGVVDDRNCLNWGQTNPNSILQGQSPNFWNLNGGSELEDNFYGNNCWDDYELRSVVVGDVDSFYHQNLLPQDFDHSTILL